MSLFLVSALVEMRWSLWIVVVLAALGALSVPVRPQEHEGGEGGPPEVEVTGGEATQFCTSSMKILMEEIHTLFSEYNKTVINCLAFGLERNLENGVVSVFEMDGTPVARYNLSCKSNALKAQLLVGQNASTEENDTCIKCRPTAEDEICHRPCPEECERCAEFTVNMVPNVLRCTECHGYRLLNVYPAGITPTAERIEAIRRNEEAAGQEEICEDKPKPDPEDPLNFHCVSECPDNGNHSRVNKEEGGETCFACGLEYCVECEESEEPGGHDECTTCMTDTILFEGECYACPLALIARTAIVQEAEEQDEARQNRLRQIELAVSLPVVCFLVIVFFMGMSVYAHHRYPHISHKGHKRHRTKKPDMFSREASSPAPSAESELPPLTESDVWRARPSVRFR